MLTIKEVLNSKTLSYNRKRGCGYTVFTFDCIFCGRFCFTLSRYTTRIKGFCSRICSTEAKLNQRKPLKYHMVKRNGKSEARHRFLIKKKYKIKLGINDVVHHIDHNKLNNDFRNLIVVKQAENAKLNGKAVSRMLQFVPREIIEQITCEELIDNWGCK